MYLRDRDYTIEVEGGREGGRGGRGGGEGWMERRGGD